jgi:hypothetical protein
MIDIVRHAVEVGDAYEMREALNRDVMLSVSMQLASFEGRDAAMGMLHVILAGVLIRPVVVSAAALPDGYALELSADVAGSPTRARGLLLATTADDARATKLEIFVGSSSIPSLR